MFLEDSTKKSLAERMRTASFGFWFYVVSVLVLIDFASKWFAEFSEWSLFLNDQFAFSLPMPIWLIYILYAITFLAIGKYLYVTWNELLVRARVGFIFIVSGGIANMSERIWFGYVRDFIYIGNGVFNIADFYIFFGLLLILATVRKR